MCTCRHLRLHATQVFHVLEAQDKSLEFKVAGDNFLVSAGDHFWVPPHNTYGSTQLLPLAVLWVGGCLALFGWLCCEHLEKSLCCITMWGQ